MMALSNRFFSGALVLAFATSTAAYSADDRPNIVIILADDMGSFDVNWMTGGNASLDGVKGDALNNLTLGLTLGYHINDNLQLTAGYMATVNDNEPTDLRLDGFMVSLMFGWHPLIEQMKRLQGGP